MGDNLKAVLFLIIAGLVLAIIILNSHHPGSLMTQRTNTLIIRKVDTFVVYQAKYIRAKIDTISLHDTIFIYKNDTVHIPENRMQVVAKSDTIWQDSSFFYAEYFFSPIKRFNLFYSVKEKIIYGDKEIPDKPYNRGLGFGIQAGFGYSLTTKSFGNYIGLGVNFNF